MPSDGGTARRRLLEYVAAAVAFVVVGVVAIVVLQDDSSGVPDGSEAVIALDEVDTESITVPISSMTTIASHGDQVLIVDGIATDGPDPWEEGAEPSTRVWVVDADDPEMARPFDLPSVGPRLFPEVQWWNGQWALLGVRCPQPWDPADVRAASEEAADDMTPETCGSSMSDIHLFDPETASVRELATGLDDRPHWRATNGDLAVLDISNGRVEFPGPYDDLWTLSLDGEVADIADLPGRTFDVLPAGDSFVALQVESRGDFRGGELQDTANFWQLHRLSGREWVAEELEPTGVEHRTNDGGFAGEDFVLTVGRGGRPSPMPRPTEAVLLHVDANSGKVQWEPLPLDGLPDPPEDFVQVQLHDDAVIYSDGDLRRRWNGASWVETVVWGLEPMAYVDDFAAILHFDRAEPYGPLAVTLSRE